MVITAVVRRVRLIVSMFVKIGGRELMMAAGETRWIFEEKKNGESN